MDWLLPHAGTVLGAPTPFGAQISWERVQSAASQAPPGLLSQNSPSIHGFPGGPCAH